MNESEFGREVMNRLQADKQLSEWYEKNLAHKGFDNTIEEIAFSDRLLTEQKVVLSLFIGLSTNLVMESKKMLGMWDQFKHWAGISGDKQA